MDFKSICLKIQEQNKQDEFEKFRSTQFANAGFFKNKLKLDDEICELLEVYSREEYTEGDKIVAVEQYKANKNDELKKLLDAYNTVESNEEKSEE